MSEFGKRLLRLRLQKDLSISEVAKRMEISPSTYREWEQGRQIKGEPYEKLARLFGVSLSELLTGKKPELEIYLEEIERSIKNIRYLL